MASSRSSLVPFLALLASSQAVTFDYVIVGGGTSGLVIANRLSELANVTVAVIEAGASVFNNPNVTDVGGYGLAFGTDIDWAYQSTNQTYAGGAKQTLRAAKAVGGTSTINGMAYTRAEDVQVDAWELLGNAGWNWDSLLPYYLKSEDFTTPAAFQIADGVTYNPADHGTSGPLDTGYTYGMVNGTVGSTINETYANVGIPWNSDVNGGKMRGLAAHPKTVNVIANVREDAARAYYWPFANRTNLVLFQSTLANKLVWKNQSDSGSVAQGVEVTTSNGTISTIYAAKEVILSAGALRSSLLLELSGVGNPDVLTPLNIPVVVDLPTVGENLQDQMNNAFVFGSNTTVSGTDGFVTYPSASDIFGNNTSSFASSISSSLSTYATAVANASNNVVSSSDLLDFFQIQYDLIFNSSVPLVEFFNTATSSIFDIEYWILLPFSRGNIHINSNNATAAATINPNYFMLDFDLDVQVAASKFIRNTVMASAPISLEVTGETSPGTTVLPANATDAEWKEYIKGAFRSNFHPVGTAAMMPREKGGVVDTSLKVYGTSNVRVVDASVLPFQVCGHLTSTLYAIAEKAADLIKAEM
ncbi:related to choline dehydrogenase and related flavoproteins [Phialocephala subalpina]|uniref:Related to choline dehydrogenase and related flavoproteins n=1 Tax=Phialocephala subalpina TaxID=576137 RepID=A0A1L7X2T9_9HELO|nr:related to choline dehydrogenase and related flavoproteins [Phialocephala subalpina]